MAANTHRLEFDRAKGAVLGGALGDALGMPTQSCSPDEIAQTHGQITDFTVPAANHPIAHGLTAASITDDTEQSLLLAEQIIASPDVFDEERWAHALIEWENSVRERGLHDLLGPSTKRALEALLAGQSPAETGRLGDTNGAAMRIAPVGISMPLLPLSNLIHRVESTCRITHNTKIAMVTAAAVAATISAGVGGANVSEAGEAGLEAARIAEGQTASGDSIAGWLALAFDIADQCDEITILDEIRSRLGTSVAARESVPAAFALFRYANGDAWRAGVLAANLGGDTDTIGAIAAGMCGATCGASSLPQDKVQQLTTVNGLDVDDVVDALLRLRQANSVADDPMEQAV